MSQECSVIGSSKPIPFDTSSVTAPGASEASDSVRVGDLVRVYPNHSCMAAACFDKYFVLDTMGGSHVETWVPAKFW